MRQMVWASMAVSALAWAGGAQAGLITYTEQANLGGSLGGTSFGTIVTFTIQANTSNVLSLGGGNFSVVPIFTTVSMASGGFATFTDAMKVLLYQGDPGDPGGYFELLDTTVGTEVLTAFPSSPGFSSATLTSPFGPVVGSSGIDNTSPNFMTSSGALKIIGTSGPTTVSASTVPEPSSLILTGIAGLISLAVVPGLRKRTPSRRSASARSGH